MTSIYDMAEEALRSTSIRANFHRPTRLLMRGGVQLLRETLDSFHSPADLPLRLADRRIQAQLNRARLTRTEKDCLYPSPGVYGESNDFDITLIFKLFRTICSLTPPPGLRGWDDLPNDSDHTLVADLVRIKYYRNEIYGHCPAMEISDIDFIRLWEEISEALLRIATNISPAKRDEWEKSIDDLLRNPLTPDEERCIEELETWYIKDMDVKHEIVKLREELRRAIMDIQMKVAGCHQAAGSKPTKQASGDIDAWDVILSFKEAVDLFFRYLRCKLHLRVRNNKVGSWHITVECSSLQILEGLWEDYCSGHLNSVAQEILITPQVLEKLGLTELKVKTFISEDQCEEGKKLLEASSGAEDKSEFQVLRAATTKNISEGCFESGEFNDPRTSVVTELQLSEISDDVGTCWRELGPKLDFPAAKIQNLDDDYRCNRDKANALLLMWKHKEGSSALAGRLADALVSIGKKRIAEKLLGVDDAKMLRCGNIPKGHVISLTMIHDLGEGLDKLMVCEDAKGNKFMVKALNSSDNFFKLEEKLVARQESLKRFISSELQYLRLQMKKEQLACGNVDKKDKIQDASKDKTEPTSSLLSEEVDPPNDESVEKLLQSCEEHCNYYQRMFDVLIKLTAEAGQLNEDKVDCIKILLDFTRELKQEKTTLFSKIESVGTQSQLKDKQHTYRVEQLQKWKTQHEFQFKVVEKLLSSELLHQTTTERKPSYKGRLSSKEYSEGDLPKETRTKSPFSRLRSGDMKLTSYYQSQNP